MDVEMSPESSPEPSFQRMGGFNTAIDANYAVDEGYYNQEQNKNVEDHIQESFIMNHTVTIKNYEILNAVALLFCVVWNCVVFQFKLEPTCDVRIATFWIWTTSIRVTAEHLESYRTIKSKSYILNLSLNVFAFSCGYLLFYEFEDVEFDAAFYLLISIGCTFWLSSVYRRYHLPCQNQKRTMALEAFTGIIIIAVQLVYQTRNRREDMNIFASKIMLVKSKKAEMHIMLALDIILKVGRTLISWYSNDDLTINSFFSEASVESLVHHFQFNMMAKPPKTISKAA